MFRRSVAVSAVVAVLLAGCTGHGDRAVSPTPSLPPTGTSSPPSPSPSPSPSQTGPLSTGPGVRPGEKPPVLSEDAKQHTPAGALLFAGYYFRALDWSTATTDPYLVEDISSTSCQACARVIRGLSELRAEGGHVRGGRINIVAAKLVTGTFKVKSDVVAEVAVNEDSVVLIRPSLAPSTSATAVTRDVSLVFVSWLSGRWRVIEVGAPS